MINITHLGMISVKFLFDAILKMIGTIFQVLTVPERVESIIVRTFDDSRQNRIALHRQVAFMRMFYFGFVELGYVLFTVLFSKRLTFVCWGNLFYM